MCNGSYITTGQFLLTFIIGYIPISKTIKWEKYCFLNKENMVLAFKTTFLYSSTLFSINFRFIENLDR